MLFQVDDEEVDSVEASIAGVVTSLSFKLSETIFRPFFYKVGAGMASCSWGWK